jgi:DNA-binding transcriptional regulator YiaG
MPSATPTASCRGRPQRLSDPGSSLASREARLMREVPYGPALGSDEPERPGLAAQRWRTLGAIVSPVHKDAGVTAIQKWSGREARALREAMRMSVRDFAARLGISARAVSKWEAGGETMVPRPDSQSMLDTVLENVSPSVRDRFEILLGIGTDRAGELEILTDQAATSPSADGPVLRDNPGIQVASFFPASRPPLFSVDQGAAEDASNVLSRIQKLYRGTVHPEVIRQLRDNARHVVTQYETQSHSVLVPALLKQRALIDRLLNGCSHPAQQQELFKIAGAMSGVLGYIAVGRGDFPLARAYCLEAFQLGDFAQDANLQAWARGLQSFCEYYAGEYGEALHLAEDGLNYAQSGPQSVRLTINGIARAMGKLGDTEGVHRLVGEAYELMSRNDVPGGVPSSISFECYSAAQTDSNAATAYVSLGLSEKVQHYVSLALPEISKYGSPWSRSLVMIDLALSMIRSKDADLDHATELVLNALNISAGHPVISVQLRTSEFVREVVGRWGSIPQVRDILDAASTLKLGNGQGG